MKIERAVLREVSLALARPFESSAGVVSERRVLVLLLAAEGLEGWSECVAPSTPHYTYETTDSAWHILTRFLLPAALGAAVDERGSAPPGAEDVRGHPMAKATVEMAVRDMLARSRGVSLSRLLGGTRDSVPAGVSLGMMPADRLCEIIAGYLADGYARVKVKIGRGRDVSVLRTVRSHHPDLRLWADANSAYTLADAPLLAELDELGLEMLEEPLAPGALVDSARLRERIRTPVCLDESICSEVDAASALELGSCDVVNLKAGRVGGFGPSLAIHRMLSAAGVPAWCGGMLETGIGRAHNLALASLEGLDLPGDISASRRYWKEDIVSPEFELVDGEMAVPRGAGIGVEVDVERIEALTTRRFELP